MGKEWPEYVAHQYGMSRFSLKFVHAHTGHMQILCFGVDLFADMLTGCNSKTTLKGSVAITEPMITRYRIVFLGGGEIHAIGTEIMDLQSIK